MMRVVNLRPSGDTFCVSTTVEEHSKQKANLR
jgi:hypothetical protein